MAQANERIGYTRERWERQRKYAGSRLRLVRDLHTQTATGLGPFTIGMDARIELNSTRLLSIGPDHEIGISIKATHRGTWNNLVDHVFEVPLSAIWDTELGVGQPQDAAFPRERAFGQKPEDTDEMTYIGTDHPGIQWLWEDIGEWATASAYCGTYDNIVAQLGIPGRKRTFTARVQFGAAEFSGKIEARSQEEADQLLRESTLASIREALAE